MCQIIDRLVLLAAARVFSRETLAVKLLLSCWVMTQFLILNMVPSKANLLILFSLNSTILLPDIWRRPSCWCIFDFRKAFVFDPLHQLLSPFLTASCMDKRLFLISFKECNNVCYSRPLPANRGLMQRWVLGPILFNVLTNDLDNPSCP